MGITFTHTPELFGPLHLMLLAGILSGAAALFFVLRRMPSPALKKLIFLLGIAMLLLEIWKQWFVFHYVYPDRLSAWFFPWQLCSMAMYCGALLPVLKGKAENAVLVFLSSYSLLAALTALLLPYDMLRPQILLFSHSFLYHAAMIVMGLCAALLLRDREPVSFFPAVLLFFGMAAVAEIINVISHAVIGDISLEANMFYITPYYPSTQPVFREIAARLGILPEIVIYLGAVTLGSWFLFLLFRYSRRRAEKSRLQA